MSLVAKLDGEVNLAREAAVALGMLGIGGRAALDDLRRFEAHADVQLRERAKASIRRIEMALAAAKAEEAARRSK